MRALSDPAELAFVQATLAHYGEDVSGEVLERLGLEEDDYTSACRSFAESQAKPKKQRDRAASSAFAARFREEAMRLERTRPPITSLGPRRAPSVTSLHAEPVSVAVEEVVPLAVGVPSTAGAPPSRAPSKEAPSYLKAPSSLEAPSYREAPRRVDAAIASTLASTRSADVTAELRLPPGAIPEAVSPLPFRDAQPGEMPPSLVDVDTVLADTSVAGSTGTEELSVVGSSAPSTPFGSTPPVARAANARITLLQYGEILAEIGVDPDREARVWARHGVVGAAAQREIESTFRSAFDRRPELRAELGELVRRHRARLLGR